MRLPSSLDTVGVAMLVQLVRFSGFKLRWDASRQLGV